MRTPRAGRGRRTAAIGVAFVVMGQGCGFGGSRGATPPSTRAPGAAAATDAVPTTVATTTTTVPPPSRPVPLVAPGWEPTAGDGVWTAAGRPVGTTSAIYTTVIKHGGLPIGVAWMDTSRIRVVLYGGTSQPTPTAALPTSSGEVPFALWGTLVAAFNSGFKLSESLGGWYSGGVTAVPLRTGAASLVIYRDGSVRIGQWGRDVSLTPQVEAVRQNLILLVDNGVPTPAVRTTQPIAVWGDPLHEHVPTWRSALGTDAAGHLIYVAGPGLDPPTLAAAAVVAGAQRAMELDINPEWVSFVTFTGAANTIMGKKLLESMYFPTDHFLKPFWRDFFAIVVRTPAKKP